MYDMCSLAHIRHAITGNYNLTKRGVSASPISPISIMLYMYEPQLAIWSDWCTISAYVYRLLDMFHIFHVHMHVYMYVRTCMGKQKIFIIHSCILVCLCVYVTILCICPSSLSLCMCLTA